MSDSETPPVTGLVAGKYEVLRRIGRGGMGSVWEGRHASLGNKVAIKFIEKQYAESTEARSRFVTEARAAATIQSKHAIQIYDHGVTDDGRPYMVMELLTGVSLDRRLDDVTRISVADTARILAQVSRALQRAHDAGIIHRDLKPENIFLVRSPDDDDETAKVLDFGIAKIKGPPGEELTSSTKTGAVLGTPFFMSPEQARGLKNLDYRSDLWSLGVIAYKCVTGVLPFDGESVGDLLVKICTSPLPVPSVTHPGLPATFDAWFAKALERDPDARFASATELADSLMLAAGLSIRRGPPSSGGRTSNPTRMKSGPPEPSAATVLAAGGLTGSGLEAAALPTRSSKGLLAGIAVAMLLAGIGAVAVLKGGAGTAAATGTSTLTGTGSGTATGAPTSTPIGTGTGTGTATGGPTTTPTGTATALPSATASATASAAATAAATLTPAPDLTVPAPTRSRASTHPAAGPSSSPSPKPARPKAAAAAADPGY